MCRPVPALVACFALLAAIAPGCSDGPRQDVGVAGSSITAPNEAVVPADSSGVLQPGAVPPHAKQLEVAGVVAGDPVSAVRDLLGAHADSLLVATEPEEPVTVVANPDIGLMDGQSAVAAASDLLRTVGDVTEVPYRSSVFDVTATSGSDLDVDLYAATQRLRSLVPACATWSTSGLGSDYVLECVGATLDGDALDSVAAVLAVMAGASQDAVRLRR